MADWDVVSETPAPKTTAPSAGGWEVVAEHPASKQPDKPSYGADIAKGAGSGLAEGTIGLATGPVDLGAAAGGWLTNKALKAFGMPEGEYMPSLTQKLSEALGVDYAPKTVPGQYAKTISAFAPAVATGRPSSLKSFAGQTVGGGVASETAGQATKGTSAEPYARVLGGLAVPGAQYGVSGLLKQMLRAGKSPQEIEQATKSFQAAGTTPSVGQATEGYLPRAIESGLSKTPGGAGVMKNFAYKQSEDIGKQTRNVASGVSPGADTNIAGDAVENGIREHFMPQARKQQNTLYADANQHIPPGSQYGISNTMNLLKTMTSPIKGAESVSETQLFANSVVDELENAFKKDVGGSPAIPAKPSSILDASGKPIMGRPTPAVAPRGTMPAEAIDAVRKRVGEKLENVDLDPKISKTELKRLYGALAEDQKAGIEVVGGPKAKAAYEKAQKYTAEMHDKIDTFQKIIDKEGGSKIFSAVMDGSSEGATKLRKVMKELPPDGQKKLTAAVINRMGKSNPSNQNDLGTVFSTEKFLTNWNGLSENAKSALFSDPQVRHNMDKIAQATNNIREGSKVFQNTSGTAPASNLLHVMTAKEGVFAKLLPLLSGNAAAKWFTDPHSIEWLAKSTNLPKSAGPAAVASLARAMTSKGDEEAIKKEKALRVTIPRPSQWGMDNVIKQVPAQ